MYISCLPKHSVHIEKRLIEQYELTYQDLRPFQTTYKPTQFVERFHRFSVSHNL